MANFVCALCLKDIHGDPIWVNPNAAGAADGQAGLACVDSNMPGHSPYHPACAERAFPGISDRSSPS